MLWRFEKTRLIEWFCNGSVRSSHLNEFQIDSNAGSQSIQRARWTRSVSGSLWLANHHTFRSVNSISERRHGIFLGVKLLCTFWFKLSSLRFQDDMHFLLLKYFLTLRTLSFKFFRNCLNVVTLIHRSLLQLLRFHCNCKDCSNRFSVVNSIQKRWNESFTGVKILWALCYKLSSQVTSKKWQ